MKRLSSYNITDGCFQEDSPWVSYVFEESFNIPRIWFKAIDPKVFVFKGFQEFKSVNSSRGPYFENDWGGRTPLFGPG